MSKTVFILGAGASASAGAPLMRNFLDESESLWASGQVSRDDDAFRAVFGGVHKLQAVFAKSYVDVENLESVFVAFEMAALLGRLGELHGEQVAALTPAMQQVIVRTLEEKIIYPLMDHYVHPTPAYQNFAQFLSRELVAANESSVSVITFNYDCALDYALTFADVNVRYGLDDEDSPARSLDLLKLHGSLNWLGSPDYKEIHVERLHKMHESDISRDWRTPEGTRLRVSTLAGRRADSEPYASWLPFIVPPTWSKAQHHQRLAQVWRRSADHLAEAERIIITGYSLPITDEFFRYLFALGTISKSRLRSVLVFDPFATDELNRRYRELLGPMAASRYEIRKISFQEVSNFLNGNGADFNRLR